jgi:uncharacterized repeat protein (TIGR02543 family)
VVVPITSGTPGSAVAVSGTADLYGVACPSATTCEAVGENSSVEGVVVLIANDTVAFVSDGGAAVASMSGPAGSSITLPSDTYAGYSFDGWFTAASGGTEVGGAGSSYTIPSGGATLYAQWTVVSLDTPTYVRTLTLSDVQSSANYAALTASGKAALNATINALTSVLAPVGPHLSPARNAALIRIYKLEVALLRATRWLTSAQAATLTVDASEL